MYLVKIRNGDETTVIHGTKNNTLGDAKVSMTVSAASSFTFIIYPNNTGYFKLREWATYIDVTQSGKYIFRGRVIAVDPKHNEDGTFYKEITCESAMAYLNDSILSWEKVDKKPADFFIELINEHNKQVVDAEKQFKIAENSVTNNTNNLYCYVEDGISILEEMKTDLLQNEDLGGELSIDYREDGNYISWTRDKKDKGQQVIKLAKNLKTLSAKPDISKICSVLYPFGATKEVPVGQKNDEKTNEVSTPRINISSVNNGKNYIEDPELIKAIGRVSNTKTWENVKEPKNLLTKAQEYLKTMRNYRIAYELDAVDLQPLGLAVDSFECGNYYHVINPVINIDEWLRLVGVTINLNKPLESTLTVGDQVKRLVDYSMDNIQTERNLKRLAAEQQILKHQNNMLIDENNQLKRDALVRQGSGQTVAGGPTEPVNGDWGPVIKHAARLMNVQIDDSGVNLVKAQIRLESSGNEKALGGDDGLSDGRASGLLQFKPGTFNHYALNGHKDIWKGFDQLLAFFNIPNALSQITGTHGWSPSGSPRYSDVPNKEVSGGAKKLQDTARKYLGVPYVWGGAGGARGGNPYSGMDCSSFVSQVYKDLGINIPAYTVDMERYGHQISRSEVQAGDMGFYGNHGASYHITLALDNKRMIYEPAPGQSCMEQDINAYPPTWWVRNDRMAAIVAGG